MSYQQIRPALISANSSSVGSILTSNGTVTYWSNTIFANNGILSVGTSTAPSDTAISLVVNGAGQSLSGGGVQFTANNNGGGAIQASIGGGLQFWTHTQAVGSEVYYEFMAANSTGVTTHFSNVVIANTATLYANGAGPASAGQVLSANATGGLYWGTASGGGGASIVVNNDVTTATNQYVPFLAVSSGTASSANVSTTKLYFVASTGSLSATAFNSLSDEKEKTNITQINNALTSVMNMRGVEFNWRETNIPSYGVIAQEIERVAPNVVTYNEETDTKTVNYMAIIGFLIEAIKELNDKVDKLENR